MTTCIDAAVLEEIARKCDSFAAVGVIADAKITTHGVTVCATYVRSGRASDRTFPWSELTASRFAISNKLNGLMREVRS